MKEALGLIDEVAADVGFDIDGAPRAAGAEVEALLNAAWNDEDEEEFGRVVTGEDVASVLDALAQVPLWDPERVEDLYEQLTNLRRLDDLAQVRWGAQDTGLWVLSGIKGWIEREERVAGNTAPGFKLALSRINAIAKREGIGRVDAAARGVSQVHDIINMAYTG